MPASPKLPNGPPVTRYLECARETCRKPAPNGGYCDDCRENQRRQNEKRKARLATGATARKAGRPNRPGKNCTFCEGMAHRRPRVGLCKCGESFRDEDLTANRAEIMTGRRAIG